MPFAKEIDEFAFADTPINETLVRDLAGGARHRPRTDGGRGSPSSSSATWSWSAATGTGKSHLAVGIVRACIRDGARGRFFNSSSTS